MYHEAECGKCYKLTMFYVQMNAINVETFVIERFLSTNVQVFF